MEKRVAIVTGASSGIGKALAIALAKEGYAVALAARSIDKLKQTQAIIEAFGGVSEVYKCDVGDKLRCAFLIESVIKDWGKINLLINNAGISMRSVFAETDVEVIEQLMQINFMGTVYCTRYAIPHILASKGSIVGVSSIAGFRGLPGRTGYSASKFAMHGFLQSLRLENKKNKLHVMLACPGYTESNIRNNALGADGNPQNETPLKEDKLMSAEEVADQIVQGIKKRKDEVIMTGEGKMAVFFSKFAPKFIDKMIYKKVSSEPGSPF